MHFVDCMAAVRDAADAIQRLKRHVPDYTMRQLRFNKFRDGVAGAIQRARRLEQGANPSSGVWRIAEVIVGAGE
ncbi:MAG: hypothetical protein ACJ72N_07745 [Labedaea sp.]